MFAWYAREDSNLWPLAPEAGLRRGTVYRVVPFPAYVCGILARHAPLVMSKSVLQNPLS